MGDFISILKVDIRKGYIETGDIEKLEVAIIELKLLIDVFNLTNFESMLQIYQDT